MKHVYQDPSLEHLNVKIVSWMLSCILLGIMLSIVYPDFDDTLTNRNSGRRVRIECRRRARVEELEEENCLVH